MNRIEKRRVWILHACFTRVFSAIPRLGLRLQEQLSTVHHTNALRTVRIWISLHVEFRLNWYVPHSMSPYPLCLKLGCGSLFLAPTLPAPLKFWHLRLLSHTQVSHTWSTLCRKGYSCWQNLAESEWHLSTLTANVSVDLPLTGRAGASAAFQKRRQFFMMSICMHRLSCICTRGWLLWCWVLFWVFRVLSFGNLVPLPYACYRPSLDPARFRRSLRIQLIRSWKLLEKKFPYCRLGMDWHFPESLPPLSTHQFLGLFGCFGSASPHTPPESESESWELVPTQ